MLLTLIDTETTTIEKNEAEITPDLIEVGAILYDTNTQTSLSSVSFLTYTNKITEFSTRINGIQLESILALPDVVQESAFRTFRTFCENSDYLVAYNAPFDRSMFQGSDLYDLKWRCATEFNFTRSYKTRPSLLVLADMYGVRLGETHRALSDCQMLASILSVMTKEELTEALKNINRVKVRVVSLVEYDRKDLAKERGFKARYKKNAAGEDKFDEWYKMCYADEVETDYPFEIKIVEVL